MVEVSLTVGKLDASIAVLLTSDHHLIEFPSILLPSSVQAGSIVKINCTENFDAEQKEKTEFDALQQNIFELYGKRSPIRPQLRVRNATQTSIVLEWDSLDLATADLRSLSLFRNNTRLGKIPSPMTNTSTKLSGLSIDTAYTFHLELVTSAGTYLSDKVTVKTHKMTDLSGITCCVGVVSDEDRAMLEETVARIGAKPLQDRVRIDTTHFICVEGVGPQWERAMETNIPIVGPEWLRACESEGRIVGVRGYYLNADPKTRPAARQGAGARSTGAASTPSRSPAQKPLAAPAKPPPAPAPAPAPASVEELKPVAPEPIPEPVTEPAAAVKDEEEDEEEEETTTTEGSVAEEASKSTETIRLGSSRSENGEASDREEEAEEKDEAAAATAEEEADREAEEAADAELDESVQSGDGTGDIGSLPVSGAVAEEIAADITPRASREIMVAEQAGQYASNSNFNNSSSTVDNFEDAATTAGDSSEEEISDEDDDARTAMGDDDRDFENVAL
ncbi:chitin biosynthesis protein [Myxozyma melibiosi]|uniref:Chitin biosynthesis protein n=1 Tax=Myxozyma melibiosi TaxID=54550 RepID=A0ABR1F830_9ASCO